QSLEHRRQEYLYDFLTAMDDAGRGLEGYRAVPDRRLALRPLASRLVARKKEKELAALLEEHCKEHAADPACLEFEGELSLLRGEADRAAQPFAAAMAKAQPHDQHPLRLRLYQARIQAGQVALAYRENASDRHAFQDLAFQCVQAKNAQQLAELVSAHRKA